MLEYNADTPTGLFEAAVFQWEWLEDGLAQGTLPEGCDQFNSIYDRLVARWPEIASGRVHLASLDNEEDAATIRYLAHTAEAAGLMATTLAMSDIGDDGRTLRRPAAAPHRHDVQALSLGVDGRRRLRRRRRCAGRGSSNRPGRRSCRRHLPQQRQDGLRARTPQPAAGALHRRRFGADVGPAFARKPLRSREGANVTLFEDGRPVEATGGAYGGPTVDQALAPLPSFDGNRAVIGSWVVGETACGIGVREARGGVTTNTSRFVPHVILP